MQDAQVFKTKIISALDFLPLESLKLLSEFVEFLMAKITQMDTKSETIVEIQLPRKARIASPRLANSEQVVEFKLEVIEEAIE
jgi:hypothetical protein